MVTSLLLFTFFPSITLIRKLAGLEAGQLVALITSIATVIQIIVVAYLSLRKGKPELKKLEVEGDSEIVDAAHVNMESAQISTSLLLARIDELKKDLDAEKKARKDDRDYFTRRIKELDRGARDYQLWAARLAKQVIEAGKQPVPFISSLNESDPLIMAISKEQEELEKSKQVRADQIKKEENSKE